MSEWISVKERLPKAFECVIVCRPKKGTMIVEAGCLDVNAR